MRFLRYAAVVATSAQRPFGMFAEIMIALTHSSNVLLYLSDTPFCSGVYDTVVSCLIPLSVRYCRMSLFTYSPPPSVRSDLIDLPVCFSTNVRNSANELKVSFFRSRKYTCA